MKRKHAVFERNIHTIVYLVCCFFPTVTRLTDLFDKPGLTLGFSFSDLQLLHLPWKDHVHLDSGHRPGMNMLENFRQSGSDEVTEDSGRTHTVWRGVSSAADLSDSSVLSTGSSLEEEKKRKAEINFCFLTYSPHPSPPQF